MIPGLSVDADTERQIWSAFGTWAEHFKRELALTGVDGLLRRYREVIMSTTTESCGHGPNGARLTGENWRACCGISYEYLNDISVRTALERIVTLTPAEVAAPIRLQLAALDAELRQLIDDANSEDPWWHTLPRTVAPQ
jgi:hypothetical protein